MKAVVQFANDVIRMQHRLDFLEDEVARLQQIEKDYYEMLNKSIAHGEKMMGNVLMLAMKLPAKEKKVG